MEFDKNKIKLKIAISKIKEENDIVMESKTRKVLKTIGAVIAGVVLSTGVVFAGTKVYESIWKEPQKITADEMKNELPPENITDEEKKELITEEEAKEKGLEILNKLGYENQTINRIELKRGYDEDITSYYMIKTKYGYEEGLMVQINAQNGNFIYFADMDLKYKHLKTQKLSDDEIAKVAQNVYNELEIEENEYKLADTSIDNYYFENQSNDLLGANFYKYYDGVANKYESFSVSFLSVNDDIFLNTVQIGEDKSFQNNEVIISKEDAIEIAKNKEKEFSNYDITNVKCELSIEKMNSFIYQIENNAFDVTKSPDEQDYYKTDDVARKVWQVKVEHNLDIIDGDLNKYIKEKMDKYYYIDATTGEIIGGKKGLGL